MQWNDAIDGLRVLRTSDDGKTWAIEPVPGDTMPVALQFVDDQDGWVIGLGGGQACRTAMHPQCSESILATRDGGVTWTQAPLAGGNLSAMRFFDDNHGWALAFNGCGPCNDNLVVALRTDDGGASWLQSVVDDEPMGGEAGILLAANAETAWVFDPLEAKRTTDAGESWTQVAIPCAVTPRVGENFHNTITGFALDGRIAWVVCGTDTGTSAQTVFQTVDGGMTWHQLSTTGMETPPTPSPGNYVPTGVSATLGFFDELNGWLALSGPELIVERTVDGGKTWVPLPLPSASATQFSARFLTPTLGWLVGTQNIWLTEDGGARWMRWVTPR